MRKIRINTLIFILVTLVLSPAVVFSEQESAEVPSAQVPVLDADTAKSRGLKDFGLRLEDCIKIAFENSREIRISSDKIASAKLKKTATFRDLFPSMSLFWNDVRGTNDTAGTKYLGTQYGLEMEQELWPRDYIGYTYKQSEENLKFSEIDYQKVNKDLVYEVTKSFYELARAKRDLKDQSEILKKGNELFSLTEKENAAGLISQLEYLRSLSKYREIEGLTWTREYLVKLAGVKLRNAMRMDDATFAIDINEGNIFGVSGGAFPLLKNENEESADKYIELALANRLEMELQAKKAAFYDLGNKAVRGKGKPKFSFVGSFKKLGDAFKPDSVDYDSEWFVGAKVAVPWVGNTVEYSYQTGVNVPNRTSTYSTVNESDVQNQSLKFSVLNNLPYYHERKEAEIAYQSAIKEEGDQARKVIMEVNEAFYGYKNAKNKAASAVEKLKFVFKEEEVIETLRKSAEETISKSFEVLYELQQAKAFYNEALFEYYVSILDLNKAINMDIFSLQESPKNR